MPSLRRAAWLRVLTVTAALWATLGITTDRAAAVDDEAIAFVDGDRLRHYLLHVPPDAPAHAPLPVLVALHAGGSSASQFKHYAGLDRIADREHFAVAYPEGLGRALLSWNAGDCCGDARAQRVDDVGFFVHLLRDIARRLPLDRRRVYLTGHSNGAMMAHRIAAEVPERIAAIATVAGGPAMDHFAPTRPVAVLHIHSVDDARELYGEQSRPPFPLTTAHPSQHPIEFELARWVDRDGCRVQARIVERRVRPAAGGRTAQTATRLVHTPCTTSTEVELWKLAGAGHGWPGADPRYAPLLGPETSLIDAAREVWTFVRRFTRPNAPPLSNTSPAASNAGS